MDDEQGPWWTRPPEPGPPAPQVQRRRPGGPLEAVPPLEPPEEPPEEAPTQLSEPPSADATVVYHRDELPPTAYARSEAEPEAEPAPPPPKPVIRRVAVVPPTPPPVRTVGPGQEPTERLPSIRDDIFATFSAPRAPAASAPAGQAQTEQSPNGPDGASGTGPAPLDERAPGLAGLLPQIKVPEPRVLLLGAAAALVILLIVIVALVSGRGTKRDQEARDSQATTPTVAAGANAFTGKEPAGLEQLGAVEAAAQLRRAGQTAGGSIVEAWGWDDKNGRNLVVTTVTGVGVRKRTLRVIQIAGLDGEPRTLRVMRDPNLPANCRGAGSAGFTPKALIVRDLNADNIAEVISGWTSRCGNAQAESQIRLALITNGDKYILRGQGVLGSAKDFTPDPRPSRWPDNYLKMLSAQYQKLYG